MMRAAVIGMAMAIGLCSGCATMKDSTANDAAPVTKEQLGLPITANPITLFGGDLTVRAYDYAVVFTPKGKSPITYFVNKTASMQPVGLIADSYKNNGGAAAHGEPLQGEFRFDDLVGNVKTTYVFHIFWKSVIVYRWGSHCETAIFDKAFIK